MTIAHDHSLTQEQVQQLLEAINPRRVKRLQHGGFSYLEQHDVRAHMNRIFGFAGWSTRVISTECAVEREIPRGQSSQWQVTYRAVVEISLISPVCGCTFASYQDAAADSNQQGDVGAAHHVALASAVSTAFKRACTNLGDQFGLSLYDDGSTNAIVGGLVDGTRPNVGTPQTPSGEEAAPPAGTPTAPEGERPVSPSPDGTLVGGEEVDIYEVEGSPGWTWMQQLRAQANNADAEARILEVTALVNAAPVVGDGFLNGVVSVGTQGARMTRKALADKVRLGEFLKEDQS